MGFLSRVSTVVGPGRMRSQSGDPFAGMYTGYMPTEWYGSMSAAGIHVTPELAMTLSAMYGGVTLIAMDLATLPAQTFKNREDGGKDRVRGGSFSAGTGGIGDVAYKLRWAPNNYQTAVEYFLGMVAQWLLRGKAYAEIVNGPNGFLDQLLPRHPDRVHQERLPSGRLRYRLIEADGTPRYVTQEEMHVVRDMSLDGGMTVISRVQYGAQAIGSAIATQKAAGKFFKSGMTAAKIATYKGEMGAEDEAALHASISRFAAGVDNSFGLALIPDDVTITNLGVEPEKAQMMLAQEWGIREIARLLRLPGHKLGIKDSVSYNSQVQAALDYVISTLRPIAVTFEQAMQRDLILAKDTYVIEFLLAALLRGDFGQQAEYLEKLIRNRVMYPSEARLLLNMNPDPALDALSASDFRPGQSAAQRDTTAPAAQAEQATEAPVSERLRMKGMLAIHDNAVRCLRRERAAVEKLAKKHASDVPGWQSSLRDFYADHSGFVAQTMRISMGAAREYAAQHGSEIEAKGVVVFDGAAGEQWERYEADELCALALECERIAA